MANKGELDVPEIKVDGTGVFFYGVEGEKEVDLSQVSHPVGGVTEEQLPKEGSPLEILQVGGDIHFIAGGFVGLVSVDSV